MAATNKGNGLMFWENIAAFHGWVVIIGAGRGRVCARSQLA